MRYNIDKSTRNILKVVALAVLISLFNHSICFPQEKKEDTLIRLIQKMKDEDPNVRYNAADALGEIKDDRVIKPLIAALNDKDSYVRIKAAYALTGIGAPIVEPMIAALNDDKEQIFRINAVEILLSTKDARAIDAAITIMKDKAEDSNVRIKAAYALVGIGAPIVEPMIAALNDEDSRVRFVAVEILGRTSDTRAIGPLIVTLKDKDLSVQMASAYALGKFGDHGINALIVALKDKDLNVQGAAAKGLIRTNNIRATEAVVEAMRRYDNIEIVTNNYQYFINIGAYGSEFFLVKGLDARGTKQMAQDFLNCGNTELESAGKNWASRNGYDVKRMTGSSLGPKWGMKK